jgi:hypothetical protein
MVFPVSLVVWFFFFGSRSIRRSDLPFRFGCGAVGCGGRRCVHAAAVRCGGRRWVLTWREHGSGVPLLAPSGDAARSDGGAEPAFPPAFRF